MLESYSKMIGLVASAFAWCSVHLFVTTLALYQRLNVSLHDRRLGIQYTASCRTNDSVVTECDEFDVKHATLVFPHASDRHSVSSISLAVQARLGPVRLLHDHNSILGRRRAAQLLCIRSVLAKRLLDLLG